MSLLLEKKIVQTEYLCNNLRNRFQTNNSFQERDFFLQPASFLLKKKSHLYACFGNSSFVIEVKG